MALVGASPHIPYPALAQPVPHAVQPHNLVQTTHKYTSTVSRAHIDIGGVKAADPTLGKVLCLLCWRDVWAVRQAQQGHSLPHKVVQLLDMLHHHQRGQRGLAGDANCTTEGEGLSLRLCVLHREGGGTLHSRWDAACLGPSLTGACAAQGHLMPAACTVWPKQAAVNRCTTAVGLASALHADRAGQQMDCQLSLSQRMDTALGCLTFDIGAGTLVTQHIKATQQRRVLPCPSESFSHHISVVVRALS